MAVGFHDLEIGLVHPDASLEVALLSDDCFWSDIEDVAVQLIFLLLADIKDVVFRNLSGGKHKRKAITEILHVTLIERQPALLQRGLRRKNHMLDALSLIVVQHVEY